MTKQALCEAAHLSSSTVAKLTKGENVSNVSCHGYIHQRSHAGIKGYISVNLNIIFITCFEFTITT